MSIFSNKKEKNKVFAIFDIGTGSVGCALVEFPTSFSDSLDKKSTPNILFTSRHQIPFQQIFNFPKFLKGTNSALEACVRDLENLKPGKLDGAHCFLTSPWYASQTRIIKSSKNTPFVFSKKLADSLIEKEIKLFKESILSKYLEIGEDMTIIENKNIEVLMNGYKITEPLGQKCKDLEISTFISIAPKKIIEEFSNIINHYFHSQIQFSSFQFSSYVSCRDLFISENNFLLIDVSAELTDVAIIKNDILVSSFSFPIGKNFLIRNMATEMSISFEQARSYLNMCTKGHSTNPISSKVGSILNEFNNEWSKSLKESFLKNNSGIGSVPSRVFLSADTDSLCIFEDILKNNEWSDVLVSPTKFSVLSIDEKSFFSLCSFNPKTNPDSFLVIESIYKSRQI